MKKVDTLYLFVHAPAKRPRREGLAKADDIENQWKKLVTETADDTSAAVCIIQGGFGGDPELVEIASRSYGDRCIVDPEDNGGETKQLIADDLDRCFSTRGSHGEWNIYEIWSSNNARRWAEGLKRELSKRGYTYDPETVRIETFGNWTGCHHKYTNFLTRYLDARNPAHAHAQKSECSLKDIPLPVEETVAEVELAEGVMLYIFRGSRDVPMAQFWDGLRGVWEPPHLARVSVDPSSIMLYTFSPNAYIQVDGASHAKESSVVLDVGDGARPAYSTLAGENPRSRTVWDIKEFTSVVRRAEISRWDRSVSVYYRVEV